MHRELRVSDAYRFFLPLVFMVAMMMFVHTAIHAALARMAAPKVALAAYNISFSFHSVIGSPIWTITYIALSFIRDRRSFRRLVVFNARVMAVLFVVYHLVGLTAVGDFLYGTLLGAGPEVVQQARAATLVVFWEIPLVIFRAMCVALLMINRRTGLIPLSTGVRLCGLAFFLWALPHAFDGAVVGAGAFVGGILVDTTMMLFIAARFYRDLPDQVVAPPRFGEVWHFGWPLIANRLAENSVVLLTNFFLGRLVRADLALASFGVLYGLLRLIVSPIRNLAETGQTLGRTSAERRVVVRFSAQIVLLFSAVLVGLFYTPLRDWVLYGAMGLPDDVGAYITPALTFSLLPCFGWAFSALFRGLLSASRNTKPVASAALVRMVVVVVVGSVALFWPGINGAVLGILTLSLAFGSDVVVMGWALFPGAPGPPVSAQAGPGAAPAPERTSESG